MATGDPIKLGSSAGNRLIFQVGSKITTSTSGIQSCSIEALCPDGQNVFQFLPKAGDSYNTVFGNNYLPNDFKVDVTGGGYDIEYMSGKTAKVTINFKRPDPNNPNQDPNAPPGQNGRVISVDSALNFTAGNATTSPVLNANGQPQNVIGFPEPVVTVKYNSATAPVIGGPLMHSIYAIPTDPRASGFPLLGPLTTTSTVVFGVGSAGSYYDGSTWQSFGPLTGTEKLTLTYSLSYTPSTLGWQLTRLAWQPVSGQSFFDCTETWRGYYAMTFPTFVGKSTGTA